MRLERRKSNVSQDRWMVSYADFITLLFAFFVVLFAFARADQKKQMQVTDAIDSAFHSLGIFPDASRKPAKDADCRRRRAGSHPHEYCHGRGCALAGQGKGRSGESSPRAGAEAVEPGCHPHCLHEDGPRRAGDQPARGRLLQLRLGHSQARDPPHAAPDRHLAGPHALRPAHRGPHRQHSHPHRGIRLQLGAFLSPRHTHRPSLSRYESHTSAAHLGRRILRVPPRGRQRYRRRPRENRRVDLVVLPRTKIDLSAPGSAYPTGPWRKITDDDAVAQGVKPAPTPPPAP